MSSAAPIPPSPPATAAAPSSLPPCPFAYRFPFAHEIPYLPEKYSYGPAFETACPDLLIAVIYPTTALPEFLADALLALPLGLSACYEGSESKTVVLRVASTETAAASNVAKECFDSLTSSYPTLRSLHLALRPDLPVPNSVSDARPLKYLALRNYAYSESTVPSPSYPTTTKTIPRLLPAHKLKHPVPKHHEYICVNGVTEAHRAALFSWISTTATALAATTTTTTTTTTMTTTTTTTLPAPLRVEIFAPKSKPFLYVHAPDRELLQHLEAEIPALTSLDGADKFLHPITVQPSYPATKIPNHVVIPCPSSTPFPIPGLTVLENFISPAAESTLTAHFMTAKWGAGQERKSGGVVQRKVLHYGYVFDYATNDILRDADGGAANVPGLPTAGAGASDAAGGDSVESDGVAAFQQLTSAIAADDRIPDSAEINQCTVNDYPAGTGIGHHVDTITAFNNTLVSVSLNADIVMEFRCSEDDKRRKYVHVPRRSCMIISGEARYGWSHGIVSRKTDVMGGKTVQRGRRISLTYRTVIDKDDPSKALPLRRFQPPVVDTEKTPRAEITFVKDFYDAVAAQWHHTRSIRGILWPSTVAFLESLPGFSLVADVGCGDGKYFSAAHCASHYVVGTDISMELLKCTLTGSKGPDVVQQLYDKSAFATSPEVAGGDVLRIPLASGRFDATMCIAVLHHLSTKERRVRALKELCRVTKVDGDVYVQAWAMEQEEGGKRRFESQDVMVPFKVQEKYLDLKKVEGGLGGDEDEGSAKDGVVGDKYEGAEWDGDLVRFERYCHVYRAGELEELGSAVEGLQVLDKGWEAGNWWVRFRRVV
jgi:alkylated DNA repair protein alkB family protein 8